MASIEDKSSILLYRVGPVLCCAPCFSILSITHPAPLTKLPGQRAFHSGIFKFGSRLVNVCELRTNFGVSPEHWVEPGRIIITELKSGYVGFWVDEILDVMESPNQGWGTPPPLIPRSVFTRTLFYQQQIHLYAEFESLYGIKQIGYLKSYIEHLTKLKEQTDKSIKSNQQKTRRTDTKKSPIQMNTVVNNAANSKETIHQTILTETKSTNTISNEATQLNSVSEITSITSEQSVAVKSVPAKPATSTSVISKSPVSDKLKKTTHTSSDKKPIKSAQLLTNKINLNKTKTKTKIQAQTKPSSSLNNLKTSQHFDKKVSTKNNLFDSDSASLSKNTDSATNSTSNNQSDIKYSYQISDSAKPSKAVFFAIAVVLCLLIASYLLFIPVDENVTIITKKVDQDKSPITEIRFADISESVDEIDNKIQTLNNDTNDTNNTEQDIYNPIKSPTEKIASPNPNDSPVNLNSTAINKVVIEENKLPISKDPNYSAQITKNTDGITITLHTPISKESFSELESETLAKVTNSEKPVLENVTTSTEIATTKTVNPEKPALEEQTITSELPTATKVNSEKPALEEQTIPPEIQTSSTINPVKQDISAVTKQPEKHQTKKPTTALKIQIQTDITNKSVKISDSVIRKEIIHIVVKGDTLWHIAKFYVDDPFRYPELARLSNIQNPDLIYPGDRVHIIQIFTTENK